MKGERIGATLFHFRKEIDLNCIPSPIQAGLVAPEARLRFSEMGSRIGYRTLSFLEGVRHVVQTTRLATHCTIET